MTKDITTPTVQDLEKILHDKLVDEAEEAVAHQYDDEDIEEAIINGLDDD